jgi:hypothetical protein
MTNEERIVGLTNKLSKCTWFDSVALDKLNRLVVYVHTDGTEVMTTVPDYFEGQRVIVALATSKPGIRSKYVTEHVFGTSFDLSTLKKHVALLKVDPPQMEELKEKELDINDLIAELDSLEKICGSNILQDIFYQVHDGKNAVTNLGSRFPDVYERMFLLYEDFGFDLIYNELDG